MSHSPCSLASRLLKWTENLDIHLDARYLPGQSNVLADLLSHRNQVIGTEWSLHPQVATALLRAWGSPSLDLFMTCLNMMLPLYCSLVPDPQAVFDDALHHPWDNLDEYAFPPFLLVGRVVASQRDPQSLHDPGHSSLAREGVVRGPSPSTDPTTSCTTLVGPAVAAAPLQPLPPRRPCSEPSRVVILQRILRKSGFLRGSALEMSSCVRTSISRLYQGQWMLVCSWCRGKGVASVNATIPLIVDFLVHLRCDKVLSVSAVKGSRTALNLVFALKGMDLAASREISMLIRSFSKSARPEKLRPPAWDVALFLQSLTRALYEPLRSSDECFLAQKVLFLLALASAMWVGELHTLSYRVSHFRGWGEVFFSFVSGFVAKTQDPYSSAPGFESVTVPALPNSSTNLIGRLLCPVRVVRCYLDRTTPHRP